MSSTDKVLGTLSAIDTFIENFPMSILDMMHGKVYTSIFDFIIDVLVACGVPVDEAIKWVLEKFYSLEGLVDNGIESLYERVSNGSLEKIDQNKFMEGLEYGIKGILMALLSSIYTCSAIPVLPNKVFDGPCSETFKRKEEEKEEGDESSEGKEDIGDDIDKIIQSKIPDEVIERLQADLFKPFLIPKKIIDPMGLLNVCPTTSEGRLYYDINGTERYCKKEKGTVSVVESENKNGNANDVVTVTSYVDVPIYKKQIKLFLKKVSENNETEGYPLYKWKFCIDTSFNHDLDLKLTFKPGVNDTYVVETTIPSGSQESKDEFGFDPPLNRTKMAKLNDGKNYYDITFKNLWINDFDEEIIYGQDFEDTWVYFSYADSPDFVDIYQDNNINTLPWGRENEDTIQIESAYTITLTADTQYTNEVLRDKNKFIYTLIEPENVTKEIRKEAKRVNGLILDVSEESPEYIVYYDGVNPNMLYTSNDMNAFIWYVLNKGMKTPQIEYNHLMWDSRLSAEKKDENRKTPEEWNRWYASKTSYTEEFLTLNGGRILKKDNLFPIVHLEPQGMAENLIRVKLPAQRYFRPGVRKSILDSNKRDKKYGLNSTIYKFNWDYINNIQILKPKILLVGMLNELLGLSTSIIKSADIDITQKMIDAKLSSAIKSVIEADDMEVENCYMEFSNDELNDMLEEMLLARYNATIYGGEKNIAVTRDINDYIGMIDQVAKNASTEGTTTTITKMVTKVTVDNNVVEPSLNYGLSFNGEQNILKKLLWAIVRPIIMALFTPQVLLLIYINFELLGITNVNETLGPQDFGKIVNFLMNKIFSLIKSIIRFVKDIIVEILLELFLKYVLPKLIKWKLLLYIEKITYWLALLKAAISCLPIFKFKLPKIISSIDNVNYADIIEEQKTPESDSPC